MIETEKQYLKRMTQKAVEMERLAFADWLKKWAKTMDWFPSNKQEIGISESLGFWSTIICNFYLPKVLSKEFKKGDRVIIEIEKEAE